MALDELVIDLPVDYEEIPDLDLPIGTYEAVVSDVQVKTSRAGNTMVALQFTLEEGTHAGRKAFRNFAFTEKALPFFKAVVKALSIPPEEIMLSAKRLDVAPLGGRRCLIRISKVNRDGIERSEVRNIMPLRP